MNFIIYINIYNIYICIYIWVCLYTIIYRISCIEYSSWKITFRGIVGWLNHVWFIGFLRNTRLMLTFNKPRHTNTHQITLSGPMTNFVRLEEVLLVGSVLFKCTFDSGLTELLFASLWHRVTRINRLNFCLYLWYKNKSLSLQNEILFYNAFRNMYNSI